MGMLILEVVLGCPTFSPLQFWRRPLKKNRGSERNYEGPKVPQSRQPEKFKVTKK